MPAFDSNSMEQDLDFPKAQCFACELELRRADSALSLQGCTRLIEALNSQPIWQAFDLTCAPITRHRHPACGSPPLDPQTRGRRFPWVR